MRVMHATIRPFIQKLFSISTEIVLNRNCYPMICSTSCITYFLERDTSVNRIVIMIGVIKLNSKVVNSNKFGVLYYVLYSASANGSSKRNCGSGIEASTIGGRKEGWPISVTKIKSRDSAAGQLCSKASQSVGVKGKTLVLDASKKGRKSYRCTSLGGACFLSMLLTQYRY